MKVGPNAPCPCGSDKKYKKCCRDRIEAIKRIEFVNSGGLYLPEFSTLERPVVSRPQELEYIAVYLTLKQVTGRSANIIDLQNLLKELNRKDALCFFSLINMIIANDGYSDIKLQIELIKLFFPPDIISKIASVLQENKRSITFTELQITNIIKLVILNSTNAGGITIDEIEKTSNLSDIFLMMNDLMIKTSEDEADKSHTRRDVINSFLKTMMSSHAYANHEKKEFAIPRYFILVFDIFEASEIKNHKLYLDFHGVFFEATGLEIKAYVALLFGIYAQYTSQSVLKNTVDFKRITISREKYFKDTLIESDQKDKIFTSLIINETELREKLAECRDREDFYLDNRILMSKPLIQIDDDQLICSNLSFLISKMTSGIYWTIFDYVKSKGKDPEAVSRFFGILFEKYVQMMFERVRGDSPINDKINTVHLPKKYKGRQGSEEESTDIILEYPEHLIFIEVVSSKLKLRDTIIKADIESFWADLDRMVIDKAFQVQRKIEDYQNNLFEIGGKKYSAIKNKGFYVVIVGLEGFPYWTAVREELDKKLAANGLFQAKDRILGWEFIDIEELEYMESILDNESMLDLLVEKLSHPELKYIAIKNYLHRTGRLKPKNEFLTARRDSIFEQVQRDLFGKKKK